MAMICTLARGRETICPSPNVASNFENSRTCLQKSFEKQGGRYSVLPSARDAGVDLVFDGNQKKYLVQLKVSLLRVAAID